MKQQILMMTLNRIEIQRQKKRKKNGKNNNKRNQFVFFFLVKSNCNEINSKYLNLFRLFLFMCADSTSSFVMYFFVKKKNRE